MTTSTISVFFVRDTYLLQNALEFSQIFLNPLAAVVTAVLKLHGSYRLLSQSLLEIYVHSSGGFIRAICGSHAASENLFVVPIWHYKCK
jgi:hypothetical protein